MSHITRSALAGVLLLAPAATVAQTLVDSGLAAYIGQIRAIDNHAHPMLPPVAGAPADTEFDALPLDATPPFAIPWRLTLDAPVWSAAAQALYGVGDSGPAAPPTIAAARADAVRREGTAFPAWALDQAGVEVMFANRIAMGAGLAPPRFRWVPFDDALLFPLDTRLEATRSPDARSLYPKEAALLRRYLRDLGLSAPPPTLEAYVATVVVPTLRRQRAGGAIAIKFEAAYLRPLNFEDPHPDLAQRVYARYVAGGTPTHAEYKALTDDLFRVIAREAGRQGLAVHIHALEAFGGFYDAWGATPERLEPVFNDSLLRGTNFVLIHGGWPETGETEAMLGKPNVYADISMIDQMLGPAELAAVLRGWLTRWPDKVLFGTDAFEGGPGQGWEEGTYVAATTARRALAMALTAMLRDGDIAPDRARTLARMVLRDNAVVLYRLDGRRR
jgi:predicted TIM-barrel fold metal-dependent hydrolase